jgi:hypothetical protein
MTVSSVRCSQDRSFAEVRGAWSQQTAAVRSITAVRRDDREGLSFAKNGHNLAVGFPVCSALEIVESAAQGASLK